MELTLQIVEVGQTGFANDAIELDGTSKLDVASFVQTVTEFAKNIGGQNIPLTQQIQFVSSTFGNPITLQNTEETDILVSIPDQTKISGPISWDQTITPPKIVTSTGNAPAGFKTPTSAIQIGNPNVVLVFDSPVTITLDGITGQVAYKLAGSGNWILISACLGDFDNPIPPIEPGECSISNGVDTKIVTFHFTEFGPLEEEDPPEEPSTPTSPSKSGGHGRTGVGPRGGGSSFSFSPSLQVEPNVGRIIDMPDWFMDVVLWWSHKDISDEEFNNAYNYMSQLMRGK